jgi:hypothetical protein
VPLEVPAMFYWIYEIPALFVVVAFEIAFVAICWLGTALVRPIARSRLADEPRLNDMLAAFLQYFGVIYGLLLGLLAVAAYQDRSDVEEGITREASALAVLYRNIGSYPEPSRSELQSLLRQYTRHVIREAWPLQRKGIIPVDTEKRVGAIQTQLALFQPQTKSQELVQATALQQFNTFYEYRRARLYNVGSGIPAILWYTVAVGAFINMLLMWPFDLRPRAHWLLGGLTSFYLATVIAVIALMDHPLRGSQGLSPEAFQLVYEQVMSG